MNDKLPARRRSASRVAVALSLAVAAAGCAPAPTQAKTLQATPSTLQSVASSADDGDTIVLARGLYKDVKLVDRTFRQPLILDATQATMQGFVVSGVNGLEIRGGQFRLPPPQVKAKTGKPAYGHALRLDRIKNVRIVNIAAYGPGAPPGQTDGAYGDGWGIFVRFADGIEVTGSRFQGFKNGISMSSVSNFRVTKNLLAAQRSDGISIGEGRNGLIEDNHCMGTRRRESEHSDCIQLWSRSTSPPTADVVIRANRAEGPTQGVGLFNHGDAGGFDRILIEDNDLNIQFSQAIALMEGRNSIIRNNTVRTAPGAPYRASINTRGDVKRCGNIVGPGAGKPGITDPKC